MGQAPAWACPVHRIPQKGRGSHNRKPSPEGIPESSASPILPCLYHAALCRSTPCCEPLRQGSHGVLGRRLLNTQHAGITIETLVTDDPLDLAFAWLCERRKDWPAHADVWRFRRDWLQEKAQIQADLLADISQVDLLSRVQIAQYGDEVGLWPARMRWS